MNSLKRVQKAINHQLPDVVPVGPFNASYACRLAKLNMIDYVTKGNKLAEAVYNYWEAIQPDIVDITADTFYIAQAFGTEVFFYDNELPEFRRGILDKFSDIVKIKGIPNPYKDGRMPVYLEAMEILSKKLGGEVALRGTGTGPFSLVAFLMTNGMNDFINKIIDIEVGEAAEGEEQALFDLLDIAATATIDFIIAQIKIGSNIAYFGDSLASINVISPKIYRKYAYPYEKKIVETIKPFCEKYGAYTLMHICGNNTAILGDIVDTGVDIFEVDSAVSLDYCKKNYGDRICFIGNLNPYEVLGVDDLERVKTESQKCINAAAYGGGFILGSGCVITPNTPVANLKMMVDTARNYKYGELENKMEDKNNK